MKMWDPRRETAIGRLTELSNQLAEAVKRAEEAEKNVGVKATCATCRWWRPHPETVDSNSETERDQPTCGECILISRVSENAKAGIHPRVRFTDDSWVFIHASVALVTDRDFGCVEHVAKKEGPE